MLITNRGSILQHAAISVPARSCLVTHAFLGICAYPTVIELGLLALKLLQQVYGITMPAANFRAMTNVLHVTFLLRKITARLWAGLLMARHQG